VAPKPYRSNRRPPYPPSAKKTRLVGTVVIECVIRADGRLEKIAVVRGEEPFVSIAEKTVRDWRYEPALHLGQPISVPHRIEIHFKLHA
jgi:TonB family protein